MVSHKGDSNKFMNKLYLKKPLTFALAIVVLAAVLATFFGMSAANVAYATDVQDDVIYYGEDLQYSDSYDNTVSETEYINYATKQSTYKSINGTFPHYYNLNSNLTNCCANVAGANIVGYYDRFYEELIPNCTPGFVRNNIYTYYPISMNRTERQGVIDTLYVDMLTNNPNAGTNQTNYKAGLQAYINNKGQSVSYASVITNGKLDLNKVNAQFDQGNPISLYMQGFNISSVVEISDTQTRLGKVIFSTNHIMVAYGYLKEEYYDTSGSIIDSKLYLFVANGIQGMTNNYYIVDNNGILNDAEAVRVY